MKSKSLALLLGIAVCTALPGDARAHEGHEAYVFTVRKRAGDRYFHTSRASHVVTVRTGAKVLSGRATQIERDDVTEVRYVDVHGRVAELASWTPRHRVKVKPSGGEDTEEKEQPGAYHGARVVYTRGEDASYVGVPRAGSTSPILLKEIQRGRAVLLDQEFLPPGAAGAGHTWKLGADPRVGDFIAPIDAGGTIQGPVEGTFAGFGEVEGARVAILRHKFKFTVRLPLDEKTQIPLTLEAVTESWVDVAGAYVRRVSRSVRGGGEQRAGDQLITAEVRAEWRREIRRVAADWTYEAKEDSAKPVPTLKPVFDGRTWGLAGYAGRPDGHVMDYTVDGQTTTNWKERLTVRRFGDVRADVTPQQFLDLLKEKAADATWQNLEDGELGLLYTCTVPKTEKREARSIVGRVVKADGAIHLVTYTILTESDVTKRLEAWSKLLSAAQMGEL